MSELKRLFRHISGSGNLEGYNLPPSASRDLLKLHKIASSSKSHDFMERLLFYALYRKEKLLLEEPGNAKIAEFGEVIRMFSRHVKSGSADRLVLLLTHSCQLRCKYCSVRKFPARISKETLFRAIDLLMTSRKKELQLQFFGGEPLLEFGLLKNAVEYAKKMSSKHRKKIKFILTTNGILLDNEKLDYLKKEGFLLEFSIDGQTETQLRTRTAADGRDYYSVVLSNLKNAAGSSLEFYTISVTTPETVNCLSRNFEYLASIGQKRIQVNYSLGIFWNAYSIKTLLSELGKIMDFLGSPEGKGIEFINLTRTRREPAVLNAEITVDCDGGIYLETGICLEEDFNEMKRNFSIGNIKTSKNINEISSTRFNNFRMLSEAYGDKFRKIIINNIELGRLVNRYIKSYRRRK